MSLLFSTAGEILFHDLNHPDALNVVSLQNQIVILHHMYQMKLKMSFLNLLSTLSQFILLEKRDNKGTHSLSVQNWLCFRRARRAAWQHNASLCINYVYSQGWSKGTDGKKIGFKEGTDAPASGSSVNLLASGLHARMKSSYPRQSRPSSMLPLTVCILSLRMVNTAHYQRLSPPSHGECVFPGLCMFPVLLWKVVSSSSMWLYM